MTDVTVTVRSEQLRLDRIVFGQLGRYVAGAVEAVLEANRGLAGKRDHLPVPTTIVIPQPSDDAATIEIIRLSD